MALSFATLSARCNYWNIRRATVLEKLSRARPLQPRPGCGPAPRPRPSPRPHQRTLQRPRRSALAAAENKHTLPTPTHTRPPPPRGPGRRSRHSRRPSVPSRFVRSVGRNAKDKYIASPDSPPSSLPKVADLHCCFQGSICRAARSYT